MNVIAVIPARYGSSRMPGKPLMDICGYPMIWWVYQAAYKCDWFKKIVIATDDERIKKTCDNYQMPVMMTSEHHDTPTSRLYEISTKMDSDLYLLLMGDEPLINAECFSLIIPENFAGGHYVAALSNILENPTEVIDFTNQKVVTNSKRETLMISRSPIPYPKGSLNFKYEKVTGVQIFSKSALKFYNDTHKSTLESAEENDLMRFVENGIPVKMILSPFRTVSVDTFKDLAYVRKSIEGRSHGTE